MDLKGLLNGNCNRTACQKPGATWYNKSTRAYYCEECAHEINRANIADSLRLYMTPLLCTPAGEPVIETVASVKIDQITHYQGEVFDFEEDDTPFEDEPEVPEAETEEDYNRTLDDIAYGSDFH